VTQEITEIMLLLDFSRWDERLWFEVRDEPDAPQPAGSLAVSILRTWALSKRRQDAAVRRLTNRVRRGHGAYPLKATTGDELALIAEQVQEWCAYRRGGAPGQRTARQTWKGSYSEDDPDDGPTAVLSNARARRLLRRIEWRGPDMVRVTSPEAAVLVSALYGIMRGTLVGCLKCRRLTTVSRRQRKQRACPVCGARRRPASERVIRECQLAYDRLRKSARTVERQQPFRKRLAEIRDNGKISEAEAIEQIRSTVPRDPRGRHRLT
jgi:hypothetical protein